MWAPPNASPNPLLLLHTSYPLPLTSHLTAMASFVSATAASSTAPSVLRSIPSSVRCAPGAPFRRPLAAPLRAAAQGSANSSPAVMMESKAKKRNKKGSGAGGLPAAIDLEIREAEEYLATDEQEPAPDNFPFEIIDEEGMSVVILKRDYKDEKIEVIVSMPNLEGEPEFDEEEEDEADGEGATKDGDNEDENAGDSSLSMKVTVSKGSSPKLEFTCTAFREEITIDDMLIAEKSDAKEEKFPFEGPEFTELPVNVQKGLFKFLELRGVTLTTTNFMHDYMVTKQTKEYVRWMTKLKDLVRQ